MVRQQRFFTDAIHSLSDILVCLLVLSSLILISLGQKNRAVRWSKTEDIVAIAVDREFLRDLENTCWTRTRGLERWI